MRDQSIWRRKPILAFVFLTFLLPLPILALRFIELPSEPFLFYASWTPNIAAILVLVFIVREKNGVRNLLSGWRKWRVGAVWYLAAFSPLLVSFLASGILLLLRGTRPTAPVEPLALALFITFMISTFTGALGEELGWRGFLLPNLQHRYSALTASLFVGVIWALWHAPLWLLPGKGWDTIPYGSFAAVTICFSVIMTWIFNNSDGSLVLASIFHFSCNFGLNLLPLLGLLPSPGDYWLIAPVLYALYAIIVTLAAGFPDFAKRRLFAARQSLADADPNIGDLPR